MSDDDREIERLLERARSHTLTEDEIAAQRASWVRGEMGFGTDKDEAEAREPVKTCNGCKQALPTSAYDVYASSKTPRTRCRPCYTLFKAKQAAQAAANQRGQKICAICGEAKPIGDYQIHKKGNVGSYCRSCSKTYKAAYYASRHKHTDGSAPTPRLTWAEYTAELRRAIEAAPTFAPEERRTRRAWMDALAQLQKRTKP